MTEQTIPADGSRNIAKLVVFVVELVIALVAIAAALLTKYPPGPIQAAFGVVAAIFIALALFNLPAMSSERSGLLETARGSLVQGILLAVWIGFLFLLALNLAGTWFGLRFLAPLEWLALALCALPKILSFAAALVIWRRSEAADPKLKLKLDAPGANGQPSHAETIWQYEGARLRQAMRRATQHAGFVGTFASTTLVLCTLSLIDSSDRASMTYPWSHMAVAVATATIVAYMMGLARILLRAAANDASTRMFAYAGREVVVAIVASVLGASFAASSQLSPFTVTIIGIGCALLGTTALRFLTDRAGNMIGITSRRKLATDDGFAAMDGISEEDVVRLAEEGIDSIHALAFSPTARLFFNTRYSLQRICDWQDQALLIAYFGPTRAGKFREVYSIRGVLDAQVLTLALAKARGTGIEETAIPYETIAAYAKGFDTDAKRTSLATALGCVDEDHAMLTFATLLCDELVDRLRIYWRAACELPQTDGETTS